MSDEFKKAMEKVFEEMEREKGKKTKSPMKKKKQTTASKKTAMKRLSRKTREKLR